MLPFQIIFVLFSLFALYSVIARKTKGELGPKGALFWLLFWIAADIAVIWPDSTSMVAEAFGIGRGSDFVLYTAVALIFYLLFKLHVKVEGLSRDLTHVVRSKALKEEDNTKSQHR